MPSAPHLRPSKLARGPERETGRVWPSVIVSVAIAGRIGITAATTRMAFTRLIQCITAIHSYTVDSSTPALRFVCDTSLNSLEVPVYRFTAHGQSKLVLRAPRNFVARLGIIALLVSLLAAHCAVMYSNAAPVVVGSSTSVGAESPVQYSASAASSSNCEKYCADSFSSPLILTFCSVILAIIGFAMGAVYISRMPRPLSRAKEPTEYWPRQISLFPPLFIPDRLKLSVSRI